MPFNLLDRRFEFLALLEAQFARLKEAVGILHEVLRDFTEVTAKCKRIQELHAQAEEYCRAVTQQLALTQIRPLEREDIRQLSLAHERALDCVKTLATRIGLFGFRQRRAPAGELSSYLVEMADELEAMFRKLELYQRDDACANRIREIRHEADLFLPVALGEIYEAPQEAGPDVLEILKWAQICDRLEEAIGSLEQIADVLEGIILKAH
jgi:uncharacterized protein Yka (UPF0111/DUF47 family)